MNLKIRIISSKQCDKCQAYLQDLDRQKFVYTVYNADDEANQDRLDAWGITDMPVVHIVDGDSDKIMHSFPTGRITPFALRLKMDQIKRRKK